MTEVDHYEIVRQKLVLGPIHAPKHKKIIELMKVFWKEKEIKILSNFEKVGIWISPSQLEKKSGIPKDEIKQLLNRLVKIGTLSKKRSRYGLIPLLPGIFENYFIVRKDTEEKQVKAAKLYRDIMKEISPPGTYESRNETKVFREGGELAFATYLQSRYTAPQ